MYRIHFSLLVAVTILCTGCSTLPSTQTAPDFVTAVLPFTPTPVSIPTVTDSPAIPDAPILSETAAPVAVTNPIDGTTTTQVNVRMGPSTASESLGLIDIFTKIQVTGRDANGSWYQIIYPESSNGNGWVRAEYVQVDAAAEIPVIGTAAGSGSAVSGLVIQKINIRSGPGTTFDSLGVLSPNDVVFITGRDPSGAWIQVEFASAPEGTGWVASEFLQINNPETLPTIGEAIQAEEAATSVESAPTTSVISAVEDGDSMQSPLAAIIFSPANARAIQINGDISAPDGDKKDWIQFSADTRNIVIGVTCSGNALSVELWNNETLVKPFSLSCGDKQTLSITPNELYFLSLSESGTGETQYTNYILNLEILR